MVAPLKSNQMKYYLDVKHTVWTRMTFANEEEMLKVKEQFQLREFMSSLDACDLMEDCSEEIQHETMTEMDLDSNEGNSTIEIMNEEGVLIYQNGF
jgi:hypothetical protein